VSSRTDNLRYTFPWKTDTPAGVETMILLDGLITATVRAVGSGTSSMRYRARFEPFEIGIFDTACQARTAVEERTTALINTLLATVLPAELKAWLHHT
jgi:hypothetical protein